MEYLHLVSITILASIISTFILTTCYALLFSPILLLPKNLSEKSKIVLLISIITPIITSIINSIYIFGVFFFMYKYFYSSDILFNIVRLICSCTISIYTFVMFTKKDPTELNKISTLNIICSVIALAISFYFTQNIYLILIPFIFQFQIINFAYSNSKKLLKGESDKCNFKVYKMKAKLKYSMNEEKHTILELNSKALLDCEGYIVSREYFVQFCEVVATFIILFLGFTEFYQIFICNLFIGILSAFIYTIIPLYKIKFIPIFSILFGTFIFRFFIQFIILGICSITIFNNWQILMYYIITRIIVSTFVNMSTGYHQTLKQNNEIADYVLKQYTK